MFGICKVQVKIFQVQVRKLASGCLTTDDEITERRSASRGMKDNVPGEMLVGSTADR